MGAGLAANGGVEPAAFDVVVAVTGWPAAAVFGPERHADWPARLANADSPDPAAPLVPAPPKWTGRSSRWNAAATRFSASKTTRG